MTTYRQGDVLLRKLEQAPSNLKPITTTGRVVLAHGISTGHDHSMVRSAAADYTDDEGRTIILVAAEGGALLEHQEHTAITIPQGVYHHVKQREFSPTNIRNVLD